MISKIFKTTSIIQRTSWRNSSGLRCFSSTEAAKDAGKVNPENLTTADKNEKDAKYEEMAFKFEREWKKIYDERNQQQLSALNEELTEHQKKRIDLLAQAFLDCNVFELRYLSSIIRDKIWRTTGVNPLKLNLDWPSLKQLENGTWPPANPNFFQQQEAIAKLWPAGQAGFAALFGGAIGGSGGAPGAQPQAQAAAPEAAPKEAPKEEKKVEKLNFDIELVVIDQAKKISIIKEVRQITGLGLKEAKDLVEKAPAIVKKGAKKEDAEKIRDLLVAAGCQINLL